MVVFSLLSYISPIAIVAIPYVWLTNPITTACETSCKVKLRVAKPTCAVMLAIECTSLVILAGWWSS